MIQLILKHHSNIAIFKQSAGLLLKKYANFEKKIGEYGANGFFYPGRESTT